MKITFLCSEYPPAPGGGIGTYVQTTAQLLAAAGHEVTVLGLGRRSATRRDGPVRIVELGETHVRRCSWLWDRWRVRAWLARERRRNGLDLVEDCDFRALLPFRFPGTPVVTRLHLTDTAICARAGRRLPRSIAWCERLALRQARPWWGVSQFAIDDTVRVFGPPPRSARVIYPVIEEPDDGPAQPRAWPESFILFAGLVCARKGAYLLAEAARRLLPEHPGLKLVYLGRPDFEHGQDAGERIRQLIGPSLAERVEIAGRVPNRRTIWTALQRARLFVFPSSQEFLGLVIGEAMLAGCPTVVTDTCAARELIRPGETGWIVPPDDAAALAAELHQRLLDPAGTQAVAAAGQSAVQQRFSRSARISEILRAYEEAAAHPRLGTGRPRSPS